MLSRRRFLQFTAAAGSSAVGVGLYTWQIEPHWLEIVHRPLPVQNLPSSLVGATLAQISDIHVGPRVADSYIASTFERVSALHPDIVVYTGDFTSYQSDVFGHAERLYQRSPRGRLGTYGILGNHDYGPGWSHEEVAAGLRDRLQAAGITILQNEITEVSGLQIVGLGDLWARQFAPEKAFAGLDQSRATIALSHNPDTVDHPGWSTFQGWILAGHTHGGQCKAPFLPPPLLPVQNRRYTCGEFDLPGDRRLYISRGVGHLLQARFNVRPEVTLFTLVPS